VSLEDCGVRRFLAFAVAVALILLVAETVMVYVSAHPDRTCGLLAASAPNTLADTFTRADQTGWGVSANASGVGACAWGGDANGTNASVMLKGHMGVVRGDTSPASATATLSDGTAHAGGDALVKIMASATDSAEIGPVLNYSEANGGSYYQADFETHLNRLQFSFARNGKFTYPGGAYRVTAQPNTFYWIRLHVSGTTAKVVSARIWQDGALEPPDWALKVTDTEPLGDGLPGVHTSWQYPRPRETLGVAAFGYAPSATAVILTAPVVRDFAPVTGQYGDVVTLRGSGFTGATGVRFNGVEALAYSVASDSMIVARLPNVGAQTGPITVSTPMGAGSSRVPFAILAAVGPVYWVSPTGNDANKGDYAHPFATITRADGCYAPSTPCTQSGTHVHVLPGDYPLSTTILTDAYGTAEAPIVYVSDVPYGARLDMRGSGVDLQHRSTWEVNGYYEQVIGFDMTTSGSGARAGVIVYGDHVTVARNHIHDIYRGTCHDVNLGGAGIAVAGPEGYPSTPFAVIDSNLIENIGLGLRNDPNPGCKTAVHGIYISVSDNIVTNNIVRNAVGYGIHVYHNANRNIIANNDVDHSGESGIIVGADTASDGSARHTAMDNIIANNISRDNGLNGSGSVGYGIMEYTSEGPTGHNSYLNNDLFNNPAGAHNQYVSGDTDSGQISGDPHYLDYANGDYHIRSDSPLVNAGVAVSALTHDFDQTPRPQSGANDIGAYALNGAAG
jgi:hypothetical protein